MNNEIEAYNLPLGCISHLYREIAGAPPRPDFEGRDCAPSSIRAMHGGKLNA